MTDELEREMEDMFDEPREELVNGLESDHEPDINDQGDTEQETEPGDEETPATSTEDSYEESDNEQQTEPVEPVEATADEQPAANDDAGDSFVDDELDGSELAKLQEQNAALLKHIESLSGQVIGGVMHPPQQQQVTPQPQPPAQQPATQVPRQPVEPANYLGDLTIDDILEDPAKFNLVLGNVAQQSQQHAQQQAVQQVLKSVPELVMGYITRHSAMNRMVDDFYKENPDLNSVKQTVAAVANDIHAKNPGLGVEDVFKQSAEATRKLVGIKQQAAATTRRRPKKPAFAKTGGARKPAPKVSAMQSELDDLLTGDF